MPAWLFWCLYDTHTTSKLTRNKYDAHDDDDEVDEDDDDDDDDADETEIGDGDADDVGL